VFLLCLAGLAATFFVSALSLPNIRLDDFLHHFSDLLRSKLPPRLFILAMILLPPAGFPFSLFLALAGIRFGILDGMALTVVILPLHMIICYLVSHTFLREPLIRFLAKRGWQPPILHARRPGLAMVGFLLMPGPPYILKTYLLSLTGLPFHRFLLVNWSTEALITLPIVAMSGAAAQKNWFLFGAVLLLFVLGMVFRWLKKRRSKERRTASHNTS
jgi:uncharacterized membrane protein YdjX (TVP38/TMEM64 family)